MIWVAVRDVLAILCVLALLRIAYEAGDYFHD